MNDKTRPCLALFYCQNVPESDEEQRQALEMGYGECLRLFPIPCSGRLEPVHLLRALEEFADAAYVLTCPEGACRYFEGNARARKRVERARAVVSEIGLEEARVGIIVGSKEEPRTLGALVEEVFDRISELGPSPVHNRVRGAEASTG